MRATRRCFALAVFVSGCAEPPQTSQFATHDSEDTSATTATPTTEATTVATIDESSPVSDTTNELACGEGEMLVTFFDVGQGLSALVILPDERRILVDVGESPTRPGCGAPCRDWNSQLLADLDSSLAVL